MVLSFLFVLFLFFSFLFKKQTKNHVEEKKKRRNKNERKFDLSNSFHLLWNNTQKNTNESKQYSHYGWHVMFDSQKNRQSVWESWEKKNEEKNERRINKNKMRNYSQMKTRVDRPTFTSKLRYTKPISKQIALRNQGKSQIHSSK